jgi:type I restriction enzyme S subunit
MPVTSEVEISCFSEDYRFDSDYYISQGARERERIKGVGKPFNIWFSRIVHPGEFTRAYELDGHLFLRAQNVRRGRIDGESKVFVSHKIYEALPDAVVQTNDLLLVRTGANLGDLARVDSRYGGALVSSHTLRLARKVEAPVCALAMFFASDLGHRVLLSLKTGGTHGQINGFSLKTLYLPDLSRLEPKCRNYCDEIVKLDTQAIELCPEAEAELLDRFRCSELDRPRELSFLNTFQELESANRIDAEHFQPQYARLRAHLKKTGCLPLNKLIQPVVNGFDCRNWQDNGTPYIRVGDIAKGAISEDCARVSIDSSEVVKDVQIEEGDVLFARKGTYGKTGVASKMHENWIISSEIMRFRKLPDASIDPYYLSLFLESKPGFLQVEAFVHGVSNFSISQRDVGKILIFLPRNNRGQIDRAWQAKLADKVRCAVNAKAEARHKLADAKKFVEDAVLTMIR